MVTTNTDTRVREILREISSLPPHGHNTSAAPANAAGDEVVINPNEEFKKFAATGFGLPRIFGAPPTDRVSAMCNALTNEGEPMDVRGALLAELIKNVCPDE